MRSGLQTPGAIPLLAVVVAALLSITPMLCEAMTKPEDVPGIEFSSHRSVESSIYPVDSAPTICEHAEPPSIAGSDSSSSLTRAFNNIDTLWQQVYHIATAFVLSSSSSPSSKQQDTDTTHKLKRRPDGLDQILNPRLQQILLGPSNDNDNDNTTNNDSIESQSTMDSTSITISLASFSDVTEKSSPQPPPPPPSSSYSFFSSSPQRPPESQPESALINASSPVDRKGSYMAILISLVVAIMWF